MKNTLSDLNNHLFMALERINDDELTAEQLDKELKRSSSVAKIAESIVHTADIQVKALKLKNEMGPMAIVPQTILPAPDKAQ